MNVLTQIGLGYTFLFLLLGRPGWSSSSRRSAILVGYWLLFALYPPPAAGFDYARWASRPTGRPGPGFVAHWDKNTNAAAAVDQWFLNLFPRESLSTSTTAATRR